MIYIVLCYLLLPLRWLLTRRRPAQPRRILLLQTAKIGDMLCSTPVILALKAHYPQAELTVLHAPVTGRIIAGMAEVDACLAVAPSSWRGWGGKWRLARQIRRGHYDMAVNLSPSLPLLLALVWSGIPLTLSILPTRVGKTLALLARLINVTAQHRSGELVLDTLARLLQTQGIALAYRKAMAQGDGGEAICEQLGIAADGSAIGVAISSANKLKELGEDTLVLLCQRLLARYAGPVVLIGGPEDHDVASQVLARCPPGHVINSAGRFRLDQLPALMQRLRLFIGVDSGLSYLADTFDVPLVVVVGPMDCREQRPLGEHARFVIKRPPCYPCVFIFNTPYSCKTGDRACITTVSVDDVLHAAGEALDV